MVILVFGDSITQGFFDTEMGGWCSRFGAHCMRRDIDVFNLGISGDCTNRLLARFDSEAKARTKNGAKDSLILFAIGVNDTQRFVKDGSIKTDAKQFRANLEALKQKASEFTNKIAFTGILPINEKVVQPMPWADDRSHFQKDVKEYDEIISSMCDEYGCLFIPMQDVFNDHILEEVLEDGIHPNSEGHRFIFERVKGVLEKEGLL